MTDLILTCERCAFPIAGDTGCLTVSIVAARQHGAADAETEGRVVPMSALVDRVLYGPHPARWRALHDACRQPDDDEAAYQIDAIKLTTYSGLLWWTNHLMSKNWLKDTDWGAVLMEAGGHEAGRIAPVDARSAA